MQENVFYQKPNLYLIGRGIKNRPRGMTEGTGKILFQKAASFFHSTTFCRLITVSITTSQGLKKRGANETVLATPRDITNRSS